MAASVTEHLATESFNKLMPLEPGPFKVVEVSPTTVTIDEDGIHDTVRIVRPTLAPPASFAGGKLVYTTYQPVDERNNKVDEGGGQTTAEEIFYKLHKYAADRIVLHIGEGENVRYVVRWNSYIYADDTVDSTKHIPEHFITCY